ncbi:MAG: transglutaminase-like domain-containing protein [Pseudomonadales bacterium]
MILRTLIGLLATCLIAAALWWALSAADPIVQTARSLQGERWYRLTMAQRGVGYYRSRSARGSRGEHEFHTELRFALAKDQPVTVTESYVFAASPPFSLNSAAHSVQRSSGTATVTIERQAQGLVARRTETDSDAETAQPEQPLEWQYSLADYLAFESWIRTKSPGPGASVSVISPNLDTLALGNDVFELVSSDTKGYRVRKRSLLDDTIIELDRNLVPVRFELAGVFDLQRSSQAEALSARTPLQKSSYRLPLNEPLRQPQELRQLVLRVDGADAHEFPEVLVLNANPVVPATSDDYLSTSMDHPVNHPRLREVLARLNLKDLSPDAQVQRLLRHVHRFLTYDDSVTARRVIELLDKPSGDCTEYADLFTTLARAAGLPARTIIGMAYSDDPDPALAFHAWNQVQVNGVWEAVDPTWNQRQVDATHWPLPSSERRAMLLLTGQIDVQLQVVSTDYAWPSAVPAG